MFFFLTFFSLCSLSNLFNHLSSPFSLLPPPSLHPAIPPPSLSSLSMCSDYLSKLAICWLLYRDDVSLCPRVHQVGFLPLYLVKPKLTAGLVGVLLDLTKGLGLVLMRVNPVWFIAGLSKKINGSPFESKSLIALCTYVSSLWIFFPSLLSLALLFLHFSLPNSYSFLTPLPCLLLFYFFLSLSTSSPAPIRGSYLPLSMASWWICRIDFSLFSLAFRRGEAALSTFLASSGCDHNQDETSLPTLLFCLHPNFT